MFPYRRHVPQHEWILTKECAHGKLSVRRQSVEQLVCIETRVLHEFARGVDNALRHVALQRFGFKGLRDVGEACCGLGEDGGVVPGKLVLVFTVI